MMNRMIPVGMRGLPGGQISSVAESLRGALFNLAGMKVLTDASVQAAADALTVEEMEKKAKIADSMAAALMEVSSDCCIPNNMGEESLLVGAPL